MLYYLCSTVLCATKINGEYAGECDCNLATVRAPENAYFEFLPINEDYEPSRFKAGVEDNLYDKNHRVFPFEKGLLVMPIFKLKNIPVYKTFFSFDLESCFARIFLDGYCKLFISCKNGMNVFSLPFIPTTAHAQILENLLLVKIGQKNKQSVACFNLENTPTLEFIKEIKSLTLERSGFCITQRPNTVSNLYICENYSSAGRLISRTSERSKPIERLNDVLLPFAFLEEIKYNSNFSDYLHSELLPHSSLIKSFLGDFLSFIPYVNNDNLSALLVDENKVRKINFTLKNGKILDFIEV